MNGLRALELLARAGFLVKGVLYLVVGALALQVAAQMGGRVTGSRGAFMTVLAQPYGRTLVLVAGVGLLGYAAWRILQGLVDPDHYGRSWRGLAMRASFTVRGVVHAALGVEAFRLYRGLSALGTSERAVAREAFRWPLGDWLVLRILASQPGARGRWLPGVTAAGFVAYGFYRSSTRAIYKSDSDADRANTGHDDGRVSD